MRDVLNQYFIAIVLPQDISDEVTKIKQDFAGRFKSKKAMRVTPHITLLPPFRFSPKQHKHLLQWVAQTPVSIKPFHQELKNFEFFVNTRNPVIFIQPVINEHLLLLQKEVTRHFRISFPKLHLSEREYNPHVTIAYRDLKPAMFHLARNEYQQKQYNVNFIVSSFHLLQHDGKAWNIIRTFNL